MDGAESDAPPRTKMYVDSIRLRDMDQKQTCELVRGVGVNSVHSWEFYIYQTFHTQTT